MFSNHETNTSDLKNIGYVCHQYLSPKDMYQEYVTKSM